MLIILYTIIGLFAAWIFFAPPLELCDGSSGLRLMRRTILLAMPGKTGDRSRLTWTRKQIYHWEKHQRGGVILMKDGLDVDCRQIIRNRAYGEYTKMFCPPKKVLAWALTESFIQGAAWLPIFIWVVLSNIYVGIIWLGQKVASR